MVTAELKEDCEGKPILLIHPNDQMHCVNDDLSRDLSESDGEQFQHNNNRESNHVFLPYSSLAIENSRSICGFAFF